MNLFNRNDKDENQIGFFDTVESDDEKVMPSNQPLTEDEILGNVKDTRTAPAVSPLEALNKKVLDAAKKQKAESEKQEENKGFFKINVNAFDEEETKEDESLLDSCKPYILDGADDSVLEEKPAYTLKSVAEILGEEEPKEVYAEDENKEDTSLTENKTENEENGTSYISDIDTPELNADGSTVVFDALKEAEEISKTAQFKLGTTRQIDISGEIYTKKLPEPVNFMQEDDDDGEETEVKDEYESFDDVKRIRRKLMKSRKNFFLKSVLGALITLLLLIFELPALNYLLLEPSLAVTVSVSVALGFVFIANIDVLKSLISLFKKYMELQILSAFTLIFGVISVVVSVVNNLSSEVPYLITLTVCVSMFFRDLLLFFKYDYIYKNFKTIATKRQKSAICLIDDAPTTFAMSRHSISSDVLVAANNPTDNIGDFMKNSFSDRDFDGKANIYILSAIFFSLIIGVCCLIYHRDFTGGLNTFTLLLAVFASPTLLASNIIPLKKASKHLNGYSAFLGSVKYAKRLENANALAIDCADLFPKGSIVLHDMKVLNPNDLEKTIASATAITSKINSPLYPVFKQIMDTNKEVKIPEHDSIKYEENQGITGWTDNEKIYIGNRTLMTAHEIKLPSREIDSQLLHDGYFPVFVAKNGVACALLALKYIPRKDIMKELQRVTDLGITVLVNNCDQNITQQMVAGYFDLYNDYITIMAGSGVHMYKNAMSHKEKVSSAAASKNTVPGLPAVLFAASKVKKGSTVYSVYHIVTTVLAAVTLAYVAIETGEIISSILLILLCQIVSYIVGSIINLINKP